MVPSSRLVVAALVALAFVGTAVSAEAEPPPPTDAELSKYIGVADGLASDAARAAEYCALVARDVEGAEGRNEDLAALGRKVDANPIMGPHLRRQGLTGRRYVELSVQVAGVLIGAAIADDADAAARDQGKKGGNREALLASTPAAPPVLARQADLTGALTRLEALCDDGEDEETEEYEEEPADEGSEGALRR